MQLPIITFKQLQRSQNETWNNMFQQLDPGDQEILGKLFQEGAQIAAENLKLMKPEIRDRIIRIEQRMAKRRAERQNPE